MSRAQERGRSMTIIWRAGKDPGVEVAAHQPYTSPLDPEILTFHPRSAAVFTLYASEGVARLP